MNLYRILGIPRDADQEHIRSAYKILARRYHPDTSTGSSPEKFLQVAAAYATLSDPVRRAHYDRSLPTAAIVHVEPRRAETLHAENPELFGHVASHPTESEDLFAEALRLLEDDPLWGPRRRWYPFKRPWRIPALLASSDRTKA